MGGLKDHLELLNTIESYHRLSTATTIKGMNLLDVPETRGWIILIFRCPDEHFPDFSFEVQFKVTKPYFDKHLKKLLELE